MKKIAFLLTITLSTTLYASNARNNFYLMQGDDWKFNSNATKYIRSGLHKTPMGERIFVRFSKVVTEQDHLDELNAKTGGTSELGDKISFSFFFRDKVENLDGNKMFELPKNANAPIFEPEEISLFDITHLKLEAFIQRAQELESRLSEHDLEYPLQELPQEFISDNVKQRFSILEQWRVHINKLKISLETHQEELTHSAPENDEETSTRD